MDMKLEVLFIPVSDVDRAKRFYEKLEFRLDIDYVANEDFRVIQFTPPTSEDRLSSAKKSLQHSLARSTHQSWRCMTSTPPVTT
jgi:catechol 2,3-dioxygenase-like lactoylglutathione lyase family enzyme